MDQIGKYEILDKIGSGGFAVVYKGYDPFIKRAVAIKVCYSRDEEIRERFNREAEIAGRLVHRHITTVYDFGIHESMPYLVEEYLTGEDLAHMIRRREPESLEEKIEFLLQIASGLDYAHSQGVIHRDIKPSNIRVLDNGRVKIMDFGTAKMANVESNLTQTGMTLGTVAYLSPERLLGQPSGTNSDIFSYGVLAYELLSFRRPFAGRSIPHLIDQVLNASPVPLVEAFPDCPPQLADIVHKCLLKDPARRYSSCREVIEDLDDLRRGQTSATVIMPTESSTQVVPTSALQVQGLLDRARQHMERGKHNRAEVLIEEILELEPDHEEAKGLLTRCQDEQVAASEDLTLTGARHESPSDRRTRKITEAIGSIESYIRRGELGQAASALRFGVQLLGHFDEAEVMRSRLAESARDSLVELKSGALRVSRQLVEGMQRQLESGSLDAERAATWSDLAVDLDPDNQGAREVLDRTRENARLAARQETQVRERKQAEAVASIEKLLAEGNPAMAEKALRFAVRLLGEFEQTSNLELRIAEAQRQAE